MPRLGLFCSDSVFRVPKLTSLRIVASMFLALISETILGMSGLPRSCWAADLGRCGVRLGLLAAFCGARIPPANVGKEMLLNMNKNSRTASFDRDNCMQWPPRN